MTASKFSTRLRNSAICMLAACTVATPALASDWGHGPMQGRQLGSASMSVDVNRTHVLRLPRPAAAVVVGNPDIADIAVHTTDTILVLGRNYGTTNVIAFDATGGILSETSVTVGETPSSSRVRIYQGANSRETYECRGECLATPSVGDNLDFRNANLNASQAPISDSVVSRASGNYGGADSRPFTSPAPVAQPRAASPAAPFSAPAGPSAPSFSSPAASNSPAQGSPF